MLVLALANLIPGQAIAECEENYTVPPGATLELISSRCYGDRYYGFIVAAVNDLQNADRIRAGQVLRLPSLRQFLTERGVAKMAPAEVELLLAAHLDYRAMEDELWSRLRAAPDSSADDDRQLGLPDEAATSLVKVANDLNQCADLLAARSERNSRTLRSAVRRLRSAEELARKLARGACDENGYDIEMVHQHMALSISSLLDWSSGGGR